MAIPPRSEQKESHPNIARQLPCLDIQSVDGPQGEEMSDDEDDKH